MACKTLLLFGWLVSKYKLGSERKAVVLELVLTLVHGRMVRILERISVHFLGCCNLSETKAMTFVAFLPMVPFSGWTCML